MPCRGIALKVLVRRKQLGFAFIYLSLIFVIESRVNFEVLLVHADHRGEELRLLVSATLYGNVSASLVPGRSSDVAISRQCDLVKTIVILESE